MIAGGIEVIAGLTGIFNTNFYAVTTGGHLVAFDFVTWGWVHLVLGIIVCGAGVALALGQVWAQIVAVIVTVLAAIANLASIGIYPLWSIIALIINGLVIYAITIHGHEVRE
jgi:hypothetical protein